MAGATGRAVYRYPEEDAPPEPDDAEIRTALDVIDRLAARAAATSRASRLTTGQDREWHAAGTFRVEALRHKDKRRNIPTAELEPVMDEKDKTPIRLAYERRNRDLDPQLVWRGKDEQDWSDLIVQAPPLYIQEKVHPKVLIDDLLRQSKERRDEASPPMPDLFADFNGLPDKEALTEFYQHDANWSNRMILGDSLSVMASLAEREGLRGKVQCIYIDPPYGIRFNSNFQWSTTSRDVKDGNKDHITREPEQVKAFRDTWRDGIHSYLTYLRDRLTVARDLLTDSGSIFVQIGDENVHRVRALMDKVFGDENFISLITVSKTSSSTSENLAGISDYVLLFARNQQALKFRHLYRRKIVGEDGTSQYRLMISDDRTATRRLTKAELGDQNVPDGWVIFAADNLTSQRPPGSFPVQCRGRTYLPGKGFWKTHAAGFSRLRQAARLNPIGNTLMYRRLLADFPVYPIANVWNDVVMTGFSEEKTYVVQSSSKIVERTRADRPHPDPEGAHEPRSAHGRRTEEHRLRQPVRRLWRARHRDRDRPGRQTRSGSGSRASMCSSRRPARSNWAAPTRSRCGSSTPTTTRRASSSATPISSVPRPTPTRR